MKSLGQTLREIAAQKAIHGFSDQEIERRITAYYTEAGYSCLTCFDYGTIGAREPGPEENPNETWASGEPVKRGTKLVAVGCPECGGHRGTPEQVAERRIMRAGLVPSGPSFEAWDHQSNPPMEPVFRHVKAWADNPSGGLVLTGKPGRGKTHLVQSAIRELAVDGVKAKYWEAPALLGWLRGGINAPEGQKGYQERLDELQEITVLAIDDYGQGAVSEAGEGRIEEIISARYGWDKPWLLATNTGPKEWGDRLVSRFSDKSRVRVLACDGDDYRAKLRTA